MSPAALRTLAVELRGPPRPGENLRAADALDAAAAQLEAVAALREAAEEVVRSHDAGAGPSLAVIEELRGALGKLEAKG